MKKLLLGIFSFITICGASQVTFGPKSGLTISKLSKMHGDSEKRIGAYFGGFATIPLQEYGAQFYIQPELLYTMIGEKDGEKDINLNYLTAPILFKAYFSEQDTEFFGEIGPQFGYLIDKQTNESYRDIEYNNFDYGMTIGIGFSYIRKLEASARFYYGFADVVTGEAVQSNGKIKDPSNVNSHVNIGLAYRF